VSLSIFLIQEQYGLSCSCKVSLPLVVGVLSSLGVFVGILTYYFLSSSFIKEKQEIYGNVMNTLNFLDGEERVIVRSLIEMGGESTQGNICNKTNLDPVKTHRRLLSLESKGILRKEKNGMSKKVILSDEYKRLFIK